MHSATLQARPKDAVLTPAATQASATATASSTTMDAARFRSGMARMSGACTIITASHNGERTGLTATAVCSVSAEPPQLLVCVNRNVLAHQAISASQRLGVNVLEARHETLAKRFAGMVPGVVGEERFLEGDWTEGEHGAPVLRDALVSFECRVVKESISGTHSIFICEVIGVNIHEEGASALVYFNRCFVPITTS